jgi:hypothetical protein
VTQNPNNLGRVDVGATRHNGALSTIALAIATTAAIAVSVTDANAGSRDVTASSYGFADSLLPNKGLEPPQKLSLSGRIGRSSAPSIAVPLSEHRSRREAKC